MRCKVPASQEAPHLPAEMALAGVGIARHKPHGLGHLQQAYRTASGEATHNRPLLMRPQQFLPDARHIRLTVGRGRELPQDDAGARTGHDSHCPVDVDVPASQEAFPARHIGKFGYRLALGQTNIFCQCSCRPAVVSIPAGCCIAGEY